MKKTLIIALLIALVLGVFTACNGEVFAELIGGGAKTITLKLDDEITKKEDVGGWWWGYVILDGVTEKTEIEVQIPEGASTWSDVEDLLPLRFGYYYTYSPQSGPNHTYDCTITDEYDEVFYNCGGYWLNISTSTSSEGLVKTVDEIEPGTTYYLCIFGA